MGAADFVDAAFGFAAAFGGADSGAALGFAAAFGGAAFEDFPAAFGFAAALGCADSEAFAFPAAFGFAAGAEDGSAAEPCFGGAADAEDFAAALAACQAFVVIPAFAMA